MEDDLLEAEFRVEVVLARSRDIHKLYNLNREEAAVVGV
jgi:hypothetical protein